jgi:hypothetical protein
MTAARHDPQSACACAQSSQPGQQYGARGCQASTNDQDVSARLLVSPPRGPGGAFFAKYLLLAQSSAFDRAASGKRSYEHDFSRINVTIREIAIEPATPAPLEKKKNI